MCEKQTDFGQIKFVGNSFAMNHSKEELALETMSSFKLCQGKIEFIDFTPLQRIL